MNFIFNSLTLYVYAYSHWIVEYDNREILVLEVDVFPGWCYLSRALLVAKVSSGQNDLSGSLLMSMILAEVSFYRSLLSKFFWWLRSFSVDT